MTYGVQEDRRSQMIGSATARLVSRKWACPECAGAYGCHAGSRGCEVCSPPRNPHPPQVPDDLC
jgi:hypothetical protein